MSLEPESHLHWQAFLYVSGELSADATVAFEQFLLEDQEAREAVAQAVELIEVVGRLGRESRPMVAPIVRARRRRPLVWALSFAAAAVLAVVWFATPRSNRTTEPDAQVVAQNWSGIRDATDAEWSAVVAGSHPSDLATGTDPDETADQMIERPLPSWLLSAASAPTAESAPQEN